MLLVNLLEAAKTYNWNVSFDGSHHDPVVRSDLATLSLMGIYFSLVREKNDSAFMKHNRYKIYKDDDMIDPIETMKIVSEEYPESKLTLVINFSNYIDQIVSQHFSSYKHNPDAYIHSKFCSMPSQVEFYSISKEKTYNIILNDIDNSSINKMKLIAKDFYLRSITINMSTIIEELKSCKWALDVGNYNEE
jgi:hypothetical protein